MLQFDVVMLIRDYVFIHIRKVLTRNAVRVRYKNTCDSVSSCLHIFCSGFPFSCTPAGLAPRRGCLPVTAVISPRKVGRPSRRSFPQIVGTSKRCDNVVLTPISPLSSSSNLLRAVPFACLSGHSIRCLLPFSSNGFSPLRQLS